MIYEFDKNTFLAYPGATSFCEKKKETAFIFFFYILHKNNYLEGHDKEQEPLYNSFS